MVVANLIILIFVMHHDLCFLAGGQPLAWRWVWSSGWKVRLFNNVKGNNPDTQWSWDSTSQTISTFHFHTVSFTLSHVNTFTFTLSLSHFHFWQIPNNPGIQRAKPFRPIGHQSGNCRCSLDWNTGGQTFFQWKFNVKWMVQWVENWKAKSLS